MIFKQYLQLEEAKTTRATSAMILETGDNSERIDLLIDSVDENVLTARVIKGQVYCLLHKRFINLTELAKQIKALYINKGFMGSGFSKLDPEDFVKYTTSKLVLQKLFKAETYTVEIDARSAAKYFYTADILEN